MREALPSRRGNHIVDTDFGGIGYTVEYGLFPDGLRVAEVFITCRKHASDLASAGRDAAILISLCLQHGASLDDLCHSITRDHAQRPVSIAGHALDVVKADRAGGAK